MISFLFFKIIGLKFSSLLGGIIFFIYGLFSKRNIIAMRNLNKVFPRKNIQSKKKIIKEMWFHFGRVVGEYAHLSSIKVFNNERFEIKNLKYLIESIESGHNCIFFSAHIGNWELTSHPLVQSNYKINFIYRAPNNKLVDYVLSTIRKNYGVGLIRKGRVGARESVRSLKNKESIGMLIDQKMNDGIDSLFFGTKVKTASAIAKLAIKYKSKIIPAICVRKNGINFKIEYFKPIEFEKIQQIGNESDILSYLNKIIEMWIKKHPEQWLWIHNRWND
tara:strand:- start:2517 stop:3344 length:828 start_codon:yes stop_codon:yes gene_type:complete